MDIVHIGETVTMIKSLKPAKLFISHSSQDLFYVSHLVRNN